MNVAQIACLVRAVARLRTGEENSAEGELALVNALASLIERPAVVSEQQVGRRETENRPRQLGSDALPESDGATKPSKARASAAEPAAQSTSRESGRTRLSEVEPLVAEPSLLERLTERADLVSPNRQTSRPDPDSPPASVESQSSVAPLESLFATGRVRGILREMTTLVSPIGGIDIEAVVQQIARALPLRRLPRRKVTTLGHRVHWLFDAGPSMLPFSRDKQQLAFTALRLLGRDRVRISDFIGHPLQAVRTQGQVHWGELHWPPRGSAMLVVGDLGVGSGDSLLQAPLWQSFIEECRRRRLRCVALIPYERTRWPPAAHAFETTLTWDLGSGVQGLRRVRRRTHGR